MSNTTKPPFETKDIVSDSMLLFAKYADDHDDKQNIMVLSAMLAAPFALLGQCLHPEDCIELIEGFMIKSGWKTEEKKDV